MSPPSNIGTLYVAAKTPSLVSRIGSTASSAYFANPRTQIILGGEHQNDIAEHLRYWNISKDKVHLLPSGLDVRLGWEYARGIIDSKCLGRGIMLIADPASASNQQRIGMQILGNSYRIVLDPSLKPSRMGAYSLAVGESAQKAQGVVDALLRKIRRPRPNSLESSPSMDALSLPLAP